MEQEIRFVDLIEAGPDNLTIQDALGKCFQQIRSHEKILVAVSGGSDSDIMMDLVIRCGGKDKTTFVFFNTGLEYEATKRQLSHLEEKYGVKIEKLPPIKPIPMCVRQYGVPFWSKQVSEYIYRLQKHSFQWEDEPYEVLIKRYPRCKSALMWWCNAHGLKNNGSKSTFDINYVPWLKEFMVANPPAFKISPKCCTYAKKEPVNRYLCNHDFDLNCSGVRKAEKGVRANAYSNCYTKTLCGPDQYRPVFWFSDVDKEAYDSHYGTTHSDCYKVWGMSRTGCAGCPFGKEFEQELELVRQYEPKFYKAMNNVFGDSYEYTRRYLEFRKAMKNQ